MKILIGQTELEVNNCYSYRYQNGKVVLKIEVDQETIGHDELKALLKNNTEDIVRLADDGTVAETYSGFYFTVSILDKDNIYECEVECVSVAERKIADQNRIIAEQNATIEELQEKLGVNDSAVDFIMTELIPSIVG